MSEYFPYGTNNWLIRALLYSHHELVGEFSKSCRKMFGKLMKCHSKPNFVIIKPKILPLKNLKNFHKIFGEFSVDYRHTADDSYLNKCPDHFRPTLLASLSFKIH